MLGVSPEKPFGKAGYYLTTDDIRKIRNYVPLFPYYAAKIAMMCLSYASYVGFQERGRRKDHDPLYLSFSNILRKLRKNG